ncbi:MAG: TonB-dependent receptor [Gammaproteobacteria bacterium]
MGPSAYAFELFDSVQVHGFLSQGYFLTTNNNLFGSSERGGSLDFTEIGVNASWRPLPDLLLAAQMLSRRAGEAAEGEPELDFGLLDYTVFSTVDRRFGVRVGRVRLPFGLYNDTRDVAFTRPSILLPQSIYFDRTRELAISADGILFYGETRSTFGNITIELAGPFWPRVDNENSELAILGNVDRPGDLDSRVSFGGRLIYEAPLPGLRFAITGARVEAAYDPRFSPPSGLELGPGTDVFEPLFLSAQYDARDWSVTGEYARRAIKDDGFDQGFETPPALPFDQDIVGESYYLQGIYRVAPRWELVVRYDVMFNNADDRDGTKAKARFGIPAHSQFAKDWTVGARYDITPTWMVRAEYHNVYGTFWLFPQDNPDLFATEKKWDIFALLVSYRF